MLLARVLAGVRGEQSRVGTLGLLLVLVTLLPLANASPPDPVWIAGIYDDADFDEIVVAVISATGLVEILVVLAKPADILGTVRSHVTLLGAVAPSSSFSIRAPKPASLKSTCSCEAPPSAKVRVTASARLGTYRAIMTLIRWL